MSIKHNRRSKMNLGMEDEIEGMDDDYDKFSQINSDCINEGVLVREDRMGKKDDDYGGGDYDSREESESLNFEVDDTYSASMACTKCMKILKKRFNNSFVNENCNKSNNNNSIENDVSDKDVDSIENSLSNLKYSNTMGGEDIEKISDKDVGLMILKNIQKDRVYNKIAYKMKNDNLSQNNNAFASVPGKFVKSKENLYNDVKLSLNSDKRGQARGKTVKTELDRIEEIQNIELNRKENSKRLRAQQQVSHAQRQSPDIKKTVKLSHLKKLSKILSDGIDKNTDPKQEDFFSKKEVSADVVEENDKNKGLSVPFHENKRPTSFRHTPSHSKEDSLEIEDADSIEFHPNDNIKTSKQEECQDYRESKPNSPGQTKHPSQGDASHKTPTFQADSYTPNLSPEPSEIQSCYLDQSDNSEEYVEEFKQPMTTFQMKTTSESSMYDMSSSKGVFGAAFFIMLAMMWMVNLCPGTPHR